MQNQIFKNVARTSSFDINKVNSTVKLLDDGNTIPLLPDIEKKYDRGPG